MENKKWLREIWKDIEWPLVIILGIFSLVLGTFGFHIYLESLGSYSWWDSIYRSLQLFPMNSGGLDACPPIPLELQIARFLSPAIAAYAFLQFLLVIFRTPFQLFWLRFFVSHHIVICGSGRKGSLLARNFHKTGERVLVIEQDINNPNLEFCREEGITVIIGDARDEVVLSKAQIGRAKHLIATCTDDSTNAEIAFKARKLSMKKKGGELLCSIHIFDTHLWTLLRAQEFTAMQGGNQNMQLEFLNIFDSGARILLEKYSPFTDLEEKPKCTPHLLVIGLGWLGECLVIQAARQWCHFNKNQTRGKLPITIIDQNAVNLVKSLCTRYPLVETVCDIIPCSIDTRSSEFQEAQFMFNSQNLCDITNTYICLDDASLSINAGLELLQKVRSAAIQILVRVTEDTGLAEFLRNVKGSGYANLHAFGLLEETCKPDLFDDGTHEILAKVIHNTYLRYRKEGRQKGLYNGPSKSAEVDWRSLAPEYKLSNLDQANHIGLHLKAIGCGIAPWTEYGAENFPFTDQEIDIMARLEHERYIREKTKSIQKDTSSDKYGISPSPALLPWDQLSKELKDTTRNTVRNFPTYLAEAGFQIYRLKQSLII